MSDYFWLSDEQFQRLSPLLPSDTRGVERVDDRRVISGIVHVLKSGGRWVDAPPVYGPRKTLYNRFVRWAAKGVWTDVFDALSSGGVVADVREPDIVRIAPVPLYNSFTDVWKFGQVLQQVVG